MTFERREFARTLRKHPTPAEDKLWQRLRGSRFHGASRAGKFRSTGTSPTSIVTRPNSSWTPGLPIRGDGVQHDWFVDYDNGRTKVIENFGVRVLRFTNAEVSADLDSVLKRIREELRLPFV